MEGYLTVFAAAFAAATALPVVSEAVLAGLVVAGGYDLMGLFWAATAGNTLGAMVNWALARWAVHYRYRRWFPIDGRWLDRATAWYQRWGVWSLLMAWAPFIGDPLTFVAGFLRTSLVVFIPLVALGKGTRYALLIWGTGEVVGAGL